MLVLVKKTLGIVKIFSMKTIANLIGNEMFENL